MNSAVADAKSSVNSEILAMKSPVELLLSFIALIILFGFILFLFFFSKQHSHHDGAPSLVLCTVKLQ